MDEIFKLDENVPIIIKESKIIVNGNSNCPDIFCSKLDTKDTDVEKTTPEKEFPLDIHNPRIIGTAEVQKTYAVSICSDIWSKHFSNGTIVIAITVIGTVEAIMLLYICLSFWKFLSKEKSIIMAQDEKRRFADFLKLLPNSSMILLKSLPKLTSSFASSIVKSLNSSGALEKNSLQSIS